MRKGSRMPIYQCTRCGFEWAKGGKFRLCPNCGHDAAGGHYLLALGWDGLVRQFGVLAAKRKGK